MTFNLNEHTGVLIKKAARLFERVSNLNLEELGVTYSQTIFLVRLWERDGQSQQELADVFIYLVRLADRVDIDLVEAAYKKIVINAEKYPIGKAKGNARKYDEL